MPKLLIFELDGGSWTAIEPLLRAGLLPHIADLVRRGSRGGLRSVPPLFSPALWTTIYTGQPRERHGVLTFDATSRDVRCRRLWDIAYAQGVPCGVCGSLVTWPPYDVGGFMIPDIMARDARTIPPQFAPLQELVVKYPRGQERPGYDLATYVRYALGLGQAGIRLRTLLALSREVLRAKLLRRPYRDTYWRRALLLQQMYADAFLELYHTYRPGLSTYHYHAVDTLSHWYWCWNNHAPQENRSTSNGGHYQEVVPAAYQAADNVLGRLLRAAGPDTTVLVLSDHGFRSSPEPWSRYKGRLVRWIQVLGLEGEATPTLMAQQHFLYFRTTSRMQGIAETLRSAHFKENGDPVLSQVTEREKSLLFLPPRVRGEGLTVVIPNHVELPFEELFENTGQVNEGVHAPEGIVILAGPPVRPGIELREASISDVTPTALALLGLPLARDMEGHVWTEALRPEFLKQHPVSCVETYGGEAGEPALATYDEEERQALYQRLRDLGYL